MLQATPLFNPISPNRQQKKKHKRKQSMYGNKNTNAVYLSIIYKLVNLQAAQINKHYVLKVDHQWR